MNRTHSSLALPSTENQDSELVVMHVDSLKNDTGSREGWRRYDPWRQEDGFNEQNCILLVVISI
jgi:hypothetical protein